MHQEKKTQNDKESPNSEEIIKESEESDNQEQMSQQLNEEEIKQVSQENDESHEKILSTDDIEKIDELLSWDDDEVEKPIADTDDNDDVKVISVKELTEKTFKRNTIEAALLAAQRPISIEEISIKLEIGKIEIAKLIQELAEEYMDRQTAIEIVQIGEGYAMQIKPEYTEKIVKFASGGLIPKAVMRTLTIIAVKQPLLKSTLVKMRGSTAYDHVKFLIDRGYVTTYNKGRSSILETTDQFADTFGLSRDVESLKKQLIEQLNIQMLDADSDESKQEESTIPSENIDKESNADS